VPDRRFYRPHSKKACRCKHGITGHHKKITRGAMTHPCWYPDCDCKDYRPVKKTKTSETMSAKRKLGKGGRLVVEFPEKV